MARKSTKSADRPRRLNLHTLEERAVPASQITAAGTTFVISNDVAPVAAVTYTLIWDGTDYKVSLPVGQTFTEESDDVPGVNLNGARTIATLNPAAALQVDFNFGDSGDALIVGTAADPFTRAAEITVTGGTGTDQLTFNESTDSDPDDYTVSDTEIGRTTGNDLTIVYAELEGVSLATGGGADEIDITNTLATTPVTIGSGVGPDVLTVTATSSAVTINGGDGTDSVTVVATGGLLTVNGEGGSDTVTVQTFDALAGGVSMTGGAGDTDRLVTTDTATPDGDYTLSATSVVRTTDARTVSYQGLEEVVLTTGDGANEITISATAAGSDVTVTAGGGDDEITVEATAGTSLTVEAGAGSDGVNIGGGTLDNLAGTISVAAGADVGDTDTLTIDDSDDGEANAYEVTNSVIRRTSAPAETFTYTTWGFEKLALEAGTKSNSIQVTTLGTLPVTVTGGEEVDAVTVSAGSGTLTLDTAEGADVVTLPTLDSLPTLTLTTGDGIDELRLDDSTDTTADTYNVSATLVERAGGPSFSRATGFFEKVLVNAGDGDDTLNVTGTVADGTVTVNGGDGNDTFTVGGFDALAAGVAVNGDDDDDILEVTDAAEADGAEYTIDESANRTVVSRTGGAVVTSGTVEELTLVTGQGDDTVSIEGDANTPVTLNTGAGADDVTLTVHDGTTTVLDGTVDLIGGTEANTVVFDDGASGNDRNIEVLTDLGPGTVIDHSVAADVRFREFSAATVTAGSGDDDLVVTASDVALATLRVNAGDGEDRVTVIASLTADITVDGGAPTTDDADRLTVESPTSPLDDNVDTLTFPFTPALQPIVYLNVETLEFDTPVVVINPPLPIETLTITPTGPTSGAYSYLQNGVTKTRTFSSATQIEWAGGVGAATTLVVNDTAATADIDYDFAFGAPTPSITRTVGATSLLISYTNVEQVTVNGGSGADDVTIGAVPTGLSVSVATGGGADEVDVTAAGTGSLQVNGGTENDDIATTAVTLAGPTTLLGGSGADTIASAAADAPLSVDGGAGADQITLASATAAVSLLGGTENDVITITGTTAAGLTVDGGDGADTISAASSGGTTSIGGGAGADGITLTAATAPVTLSGGAEDDTLSVGTADDTLNVDGGDGADAISLPSLDGAAVVTGGAGADTLTLGTAAAALTVDGGADGDTISVADAGDSSTIGGGAGADRVTLTAASGDVTLTGGTEGDTLSVGTTTGTLDVDGGDGADAISVASAEGSSTIGGGAGADGITLTAATAPVTLSGGAEDDTLSVGTADDTLNVDGGDGADAISLPSLDGAAVVTGGAGADTLTLGTAAAALTVDGGADGDTISVADAGDSSTIGGGAGADRVTLTAASGDVTLTGGTEGDTLSVGTTTGTLDVDGGDGADAISVASAEGSSTIGGGAGADGITLTAATAPVTLSGGAEDDTLSVGTADDTLNVDGGDGADTIAITSAQAPTTLSGGAGDDGLTIGAATDSVQAGGGDGNDTIFAGTGLLDPLVGPFTFTGGPDEDRLVVNDSAETSAHSYEVSNTAVERTTVGEERSFTYDPNDFEAVELFAGEGDDTISVPSTALDVPVTINAGPGADHVTVGTGTLDDLLAAVSVAGGGNAGDTLDIDDSTDTTNNDYTLTDVRVSRPADAPPPTDVVIEYSGIAALVFTAGDGDDTLDVQGTADILVTLSAGAGADDIDVSRTTGPVTVDAGAGDDDVSVTETGDVMTIYGGAGADAVTVGAGTLDDIGGSVSVAGGGDEGDMLEIDDSTDDDVSNDYLVETTKVTRTWPVGNSLEVSFTGVTALTVRAGKQNDTISVPQTAAGTAVAVAAGLGSDLVTVGNGTLDGLLGPLTLDAGTDPLDGDVDQLVVDDSADADDNSYRVNATAVDRTTVGSEVIITYGAADFEGLWLLSGTGADLILVPSTAVDVPVTINGGAGVDAVVVGGTSLDTLPAAVDVVGDGTDRLEVNDSADATDNDYTLSDDTITRVGAADVTYAGLAELVLTAGTGNDAITVADTPTGVPVTVQAGAGADDVTLEETGGAITVQGGAGTDTVAVGIGTLDNLGGDVSVRGGPAGDVGDFLDINDSADATGSAYTINTVRVARGTRNVDYSDIALLRVTAGDGRDTVAVQAIDVSATVVTGIGDDAVTVGNGSLDPVAGPLDLDAGAGTDSLTVNDSADTTDNAYTVTAAAVSRTNGPARVYPYPSDSFERVTLLAGVGNDTVAVSGTAEDVQVSVNGGAGADRVAVGTGTLDPLLSDVAVSGGLVGDAFTDVLEVNDLTDADANFYTVTNNRVRRETPLPPVPPTATRTIDYAAFDQAQVAAGRGNDRIHVLSTGVPTTVNGGLGTDTVNAGVGTMDSLVGALSPVDAGGADNQLNFDDSANAAGHTYTLQQLTPFADGRLTRTGGAAIPSIPFPDDFQFATLLGGPGADTVIGHTGTITPFDLFGGAGADTFDLTYLSGRLFGGDGPSTELDTLIGRPANLTFNVTGLNQGTAPGLVQNGFTGVENLTGSGSAGTDRFFIRDGGTLTGTVDGNGGENLLVGDNAGRRFVLAADRAGVVTDLSGTSTLVGGFTDIDSLFGGTGPDQLILGSTLDPDSLALFHGGRGRDSVDFGARTTAQTVTVLRYADDFALESVPTSEYVGYVVRDLQGTVRDHIQGIDRIAVDDTNVNYDELAASSDTVVDAMPNGATWAVKGTDTFLTRPGFPEQEQALRTLHLSGFERLQGGGGADTFEADVAALDTQTDSRFLLQGGGGQNELRVLGTPAADTFRFLKRQERWPTLPAADANFAGVREGDGPRMLYDGMVKIDVRGGDGNDKFVVNPGDRIKTTRPAVGMYGVEVEDVILTGGKGDDLFLVVPHQPPKKQNTKPVKIQVIGGETTQPLTQTNPLLREKDTMVLFALPIRVKANFPVYGRATSGPASNTFRLMFNGRLLGAVQYYNMYTVVATPKVQPTRVDFPVAGANEFQPTDGQLSL